MQDYSIREKHETSAGSLRLLEDSRIGTQTTACKGCIFSITDRITSQALINGQLTWEEKEVVGSLRAHAASFIFSLFDVIIPDPVLTRSGHSQSGLVEYERACLWRGIQRSQSPGRCQPAQSLRAP